jgi:hypothetical protein
MSNLNITCTICGDLKPFDSFRLTFGNGYVGRYSFCKDCENTKSRLRNRGARYKRKQKRTTEKNRQYTINYRAKYPERVKADSKLRWAIRIGRIIREPCEVCGSTNSQAHHEDYSKPLEVKWLCPLHHGQVHWT